MQKLTYLTNAMADKNDGQLVNQMVKGLYDRMSSQMNSSAGLVITATSGKKLPKTGSSICYGTIKGKPFTIAAGVDLCAVSGTVANATFNVFCFFATAPGSAITATSMESAMGVAATLLKDVKFPPFPEGKTLIGYIIVNPAGTGDFVGNTTALDDGTVFSSGGVVYVSPVGPFDPTATL